MRGEGLLDTNIVIHLPRLTADDLPMVASISAVTVAELAAGVHAVGGDDSGSRAERGRRLQLLQEVERQFEPLPFDGSAARAYGRLTSLIRDAGRSPRSRTADLMIAAVAVARGLPLYTTNGDDFLGLEPELVLVRVTRPTVD
jgi:predicted nucleic acid-binding protein